MNLKFICPENFENAKAICERVQEYLPNMIYGVEIIRTNRFAKTYEVRDILPKIERIFKLDWEKDIVFVVIPEVLYFADLELYGAGATLDKLLLKSDGTTSLPSRYCLYVVNP